jgi:methyltransferase (TIGR00027 family)
VRHTPKIAIQYPASDKKNIIEQLQDKQYMPSFSALAVIYCLHALSRCKRWHALVPVEDVAFYRYCLDYYSRYSKLLGLIYKLPEAWCLKTIELALAYGAPQHFAFRKQKIRSIINQAIDLGVTQIVNIGAGFDLELFRTSQQNSQLRCIEIDTPLMVSDKEKLLTSHYRILPSNFHLIGADLTCDSIEKILLDNGVFDAARKTLFILEGVSMYLQEKQVVELLEQLRRIGQSRAQLALTALEPIDGTQKSFFIKLGGWLLASHQENYHWRIKQGEVSDFLAGFGLHVLECVSYSRLQESSRDPLELSQLDKQSGEYLVWASIG